MSITAGDLANGRSAQIFRPRDLEKKALNCSYQAL